MASTRSDHSGAELFESMYRQAEDPWDFAESPYERSRYERIIAHIPADRYRRAFEPGCSVGVLTELLSQRCGSVHATDIAPTALARARARCRACRNVRIDGSGIEPGGPVDLIVFSEVGYYLEPDRLAEVLQRLVDALEPGGRLIACHWTGASADHVQTGAAVHVAVDEACAGWHHHATEAHRDADHDGYLLDVWDRPERSS